MFFCNIKNNGYNVLKKGEVMKILICNLGIGGGGAERVLIDFLSYWQKQATGGGAYKP